MTIDIFMYHILEKAELFRHIEGMSKKYIYERMNCKSPREQIR